MSKANRPPTGKDVDRVLEIDKRRKQVAALRRQGASIADIARTLDIAERTARNDLTAILTSVRDTFDARETMMLELERLDRMQLAVYNDAINGDDKKIATVLKIMERRSKYLGLDAEPERDTNSPVTVVVNPQLFPPAVQDRLAAQAEEPIAGEETDDDDE